MGLPTLEQQARDKDPWGFNLDTGDIDWDNVTLDECRELCWPAGNPSTLAVIRAGLGEETALMVTEIYDSALAGQYPDPDLMGLLIKTTLAEGDHPVFALGAAGAALELAVSQRRASRPAPPEATGIDLRVRTALDLEALALADPTFLISRVLISESPRFIGGAKKTLKSQWAIAEAVALASGLPLLGYEHWSVSEPMPVLYLTGEGGEGTFARRVRRIAHSTGTDLHSLQHRLHWTDARGRMHDPAFVDAIARQVEKLGVRQVYLDPLYSYHGGQAEASNVFQMGDLLAGFWERLRVFGGVGLSIVHHTVKHTTGPIELDNLTQSGIAEFADSWLLLWHQQEPDPTNGEYRLGVRAGGRYSELFYSVEWHDGPFDFQKVRHTNDPSWDVALGDHSLASKTTKASVTDSQAKEQIRSICALHAQTLTEIRGQVSGVRFARVTELVEEMEKDGELVEVRVRRTDKLGRLQPEVAAYSTVPTTTGGTP